VADWRASGESAKAFSARHGLAANTLRWWALRLVRKYGDAPGVKPELEPAPTSPRRLRRKRAKVRLAKVIKVATSTLSVSSGRQGVIAIELLDVRARITVELGVDRETLATVVQVLGGGEAR
jgi:transposase-like protein